MTRAEAVESATYIDTAVLEPDAEAGGYTVTCPASPGLVTEGDTLKGGRSDGGGRHQSYLESLRKDGEPISLSEEYETEPISGSVMIVLAHT